MKINTFVGHWFVVLIGSVSIALLAILSFTQKASASGEFVTTWKTDISIPGERTINIPTNPDYIYNYTIDWGDGIVENNVITSMSHTYSSAGIYTVSISGTFPHLYMNGYDDAIKIQSVESWGNIQWQSMDSAFKGASNLVINASDAPDLSNATSLAHMFNDAQSINSDLSAWDVGNINDFSYMFRRAITFNQDISSWDVGSGTNFTGMFFSATQFNQNINSWDMGSAVNLQNMFVQARNFNQPIGSWNTAAVSDTRNMFLEAFAFNQDLSGWNTSNLVRADFMFFDARSFNQNLGGWNISSLQNAELIFNESAISSENYDATLTGWRTTAVNNNVALTGTQVGYCSSSIDRAFLRTVLSWFIGDAGVDADRCRPLNISLIEIGTPQIAENDENGLVGMLVTESVDPSQTFTYSFGCEIAKPDSAYLELVDNELRVGESLDYENPQDENGDNVYEVCIRSTDTNSLYTEQIFNITITDVEEVEPPVEENQGGNENNNSGNKNGNAGEPQVLGTSTSKSTNNTAQNQGGQVLADSTTLSKTGNSPINFIFAGIALVLCTSLLFWFSKRAKPYQFYR